MATMKETLNALTNTQLDKTQFEKNFQIVKNWLDLNDFVPVIYPEAKWICATASQGDVFTASVTVGIFRVGYSAVLHTFENLSPDLEWRVRLNGNFDIEVPTVETLKKEQRFISRIPLGGILQGAQVIELLERIKSELAA